MNSSGLTFGITAIANAMADNLSDDELSIAAAAFTQLGDTLTTILAQRNAFNNNNNDNNSDLNKNK